MADRLNELLATATAPVVAKLRNMTPLDVDTAVGAIFVVCALVVQIGLVVAVRAVVRTVGGTKKPVPIPGTGATEATPTPTAPTEEAPAPTSDTSAVNISGFAWMQAAGITPAELATESGDVMTPGKTQSSFDSAPATPGGYTESVAPLSPMQKPSAHYAKLTPGELQRLREFRGLLTQAAVEDPTLLNTSDLKRFVNDACLCRYLRARKWNLKKALKMLFATLKWRQKTRPERVTWKDVRNEASTGKQYVSGTDKEGRNVLVMRPGRENTKEHAGNIRFLIYTLEHATWRDCPEDDVPLGSHVEHHNEKLVLLINFTGWTLATAPPMKTSRETLSILQDHFPERLAVAVCYNPPWIFAVFWKAISPFIDPATYRKIRFVNPKRHKEQSRMGKMFNASTLDDDMGGERESKFNLKTFGETMEAYDARKADCLGKFAAAEAEKGE